MRQLAGPTAAVSKKLKGWRRQPSEMAINDKTFTGWGKKAGDLSRISAIYTRSSKRGNHGVYVIYLWQALTAQVGNHYVVDL